MKRILYLDNCNDPENIKFTVGKIGRLSLDAQAKGGEKLEVTVHEYNGGDISTLISIIPDKYDAVVFNYGLLGRKTGLDFARELHKTGYQKPIIIYGHSTDFPFGQDKDIIKELNLHVADKSLGPDALHNDIQSYISAYEKTQTDLPKH